MKFNIIMKLYDDYVDSQSMVGNFLAMVNRHRETTALKLILIYYAENQH